MLAVLNSFKGASVQNFFHKLSILLTSFFLVSCGGGGGSPGTVSGSSGNNVNPNGKVIIGLFDSTGNPTNSVANNKLITARATVTDASGNPAKNIVVTFTLSGALATLAPTSGTALTDARGIAQVMVVGGTAAGAMTVTASATVVGTTTASATAAFQINAGTTPANPNGKIEIGLVGANNMSGNLVTSASALTAKAILTNELGLPAAGVVVTFTVDSGIAVLSPTSGTALTDSNGVAQVSLAAGVGTGAGTITASATIVAANLISTSTTFTVGTSNTAVAAAVNFVSATPSNKSIVIKGAGGNGRTEVALLTFAVVDSSNNGIANRKVNFTTQSSETVTLVSNSAITDSAGRVTAAVSSGTRPTTVRVVATVDGTTTSAISDTVAVTTGLPVNAAFTILRQRNNVEGFDFGNIQNVITVLLADESGGVVADGTPVVFTADSGAIIGDGGTSDTARCLTTLGACSVTWRSQSPNKSVVTITATSTNANETLAGVTQFTNSASSGTVSGLPPLVVDPATGISYPTVTFPANGCTSAPLAPSQNFNIVVTDRNGYVMPDATALTAADPISASMTIFPASVATTNSVSAGGTSHQLRISPAAPCTAGTTGHVYLGVKSPLGVTQLYLILVKY